MGQVPQYLMIGNGRVARSLGRYFDLLKIPYQTWSRQEPLSSLIQRVQSSSHLLLLISDDAIEAFLQKDFLAGKTIVHCSGRLVTDKAFGAHPLMSFSQASIKTLRLEDYRQIPFIIEAEGPEFASLLPGLPNSSFKVPRGEKAYYHALCVLSGNFSVLLWQKLFTELSARWNIPAASAKAYLSQIHRSLLDNPATALTGPLSRGDRQTLQANYQALLQNDDPFADVYKTIVKVSGYELERTKT